MKTETEVDGQCKCGLWGDGTAGRDDAKHGCVDKTDQTRRPHIEVGKDAIG